MTQTQTDTDTDTRSNTDLLRGAHADLIESIRDETDLTLEGVRLETVDGTPTASIVRVASIPQSVDHAAADVQAWSEDMVDRLADERKTYEPQAGSTPAVLVLNMSITLKQNGNPAWVGMVGSDLFNRKRVARAERTASRIAETGGFRVNGASVADDDVGDDSITVITKGSDWAALTKRIFPSARKAAAALARYTFGPEWFAEDKNQRKAWARDHIISAREDAVEQVSEPDTVATPSSTPATVTKAALLERASMLGLSIPKSRTKAQVQEALDGHIAGLREAGVL